MRTACSCVLLLLFATERWSLSVWLMGERINWHTAQQTQNQSIWTDRDKQSGCIVGRCILIWKVIHHFCERWGMPPRVKLPTTNVLHHCWSSDTRDSIAHLRHFILCDWPSLSFWIVTVFMAEAIQPFRCCFNAVGCFACATHIIYVKIASNKISFAMIPVHSAVWHINAWPNEISSKWKSIVW